MNYEIYPVPQKKKKKKNYEICPLQMKGIQLAPNHVYIS